MKYLFTAVTIALAVNFSVYSQTGYEAGYFITNTGDKVEGLIKNKDWVYNPEEISFKVSENSPAQIQTIDSIREFGINGKSKFQRATVNIDKSTEFLNSLEQDSKPKFEEEQLFLKVLIEGKANLFFYEDRDLKKFFFKINDSDIEQLLFKSYLTGKNQVAENNYYKQQLLNNLKCESISNREIQNLDYTAGRLIRLFTDYNECENADFKKFSRDHGKTEFNLSLKAGVKNSSLEITNSSVDSRDTDFGDQTGFTVGVEAEFILPFHNNKWGLVVEAAYQNYLLEKETPGLTSKVTYHSIEVPFGLRHYMFLNQDSKLFLNALMVMDLEFDSKFDFKREAISTLDIQSGSNIALGFGYNYNNRYSVEVRYHTSRDLLTNYGPWSSSYNTIALIVGYTIF